MKVQSKLPKPTHLNSLWWVFLALMELLHKESISDLMANCNKGSYVPQL